MTLVVSSANSVTKYLAELFTHVILLVNIDAEWKWTLKPTNYHFCHFTMKRTKWSPTQIPGCIRQTYFMSCCMEDNVLHNGSILKCLILEGQTKVD